MTKSVGQTKDGSYQFGVRKTFDVSVEDAWDFLMSDKGLNLWLGTTKEPLELKKFFETTKGHTGFIRLIKPYSHIRLQWKIRTWQNFSLLQIRVIPNGAKTTISFHQENLDDANQRAEMKIHWTNVMEKISKQFM